MIKGKNCRALSNLSNISKDTKEVCKEKSMNILKSYCQGFNMKLNQIKKSTQMQLVLIQILYILSKLV